MPSPKTIAIIIDAYDEELHQERLQLGNYIDELNKLFQDKGVYFKLEFCDNLYSELNKLEDQLNNSEFYYIIFSKNASEQMIDDFDMALKRFKETGVNPFAFLRNQIAHCFDLAFSGKHLAVFSNPFF